MIITPDLIKELRNNFALNWQGCHGASHWARVRSNGLEIAKTVSARTDVIELFSFLHDSMRANEYNDPYHGTRASYYAESLHGKLFELDDEGMELLKIACDGHSNGLMTADITVQVCWDSDRLDLGRVGIKPDPKRLCTPAAKALLDWSYARSVKWLNEDE